MPWTTAALRFAPHALASCVRSEVVNLYAPSNKKPAVRAGRVRVSFHVYNDESDVQTLLAALR